jgi:hypothetical protein
MKNRNKKTFKIIHGFKKIGVHYFENENNGRIKLLAEFHYETIDEFNTATLYSNILAQSENLLDIVEEHIDGLRTDSIIADISQQIYFNCLGFRRNNPLPKFSEEDLKQAEERTMNKQKPFTFLSEKSINESLKQLNNLNPICTLNQELTENIRSKVIKRIDTKNFEKSLLLERLEKLKKAESAEFTKRKQFRHNLPEIQDQIKRIKSWLAEY